VWNAVAKFPMAVSSWLRTGGTMRLGAALPHSIVLNWPLCLTLVLLLQERLSKEPNSEVAQCCKDYPNSGSNQVPDRLTVFPHEYIAGRHDYREEERNADKPTETQPARHENPLPLEILLRNDTT